MVDKTKDVKLTHHRETSSNEISRPGEMQDSPVKGGQLPKALSEIERDEMKVEDRTDRDIGKEEDHLQLVSGTKIPALLDFDVAILRQAKDNGKSKNVQITIDWHDTGVLIIPVPRGENTELFYTNIKCITNARISYWYFRLAVGISSTCPN